MANQYQTGPIVAIQGQISNARGDKTGAGAVIQANGKYADLMRNGQLFNYSVTSAAALLLTNTTACGPTIFNPSGSGVIMYPLMLIQNWLSGVTVAGAVQWMITKNAGANIGTGNPIVTFTDTTAPNMLVGAPGVPASAVRFAQVTSTFTAAPTFWYASGLNYKTEAGDYLAEVDYEGSLSIYPGNALTLCYSVTTSTALYFSTIIGCEVPI